MRLKTILALCLIMAVFCAAANSQPQADAAKAAVADNTLTAKEQADGWKLLFDGKTLSGWHVANPKKTSWTVEDGTISCVPKGDDLKTDAQYGNFMLSVDFKEDTVTNSGVFLRVPLHPTKGCRGIECQIYYQKNGTETGKHACGGIYDAVAPSKNMCKGPGVWQNMQIDCRENIIKITLNGELVTTMNLDEWTVAGKAPDGSKNKFTVAYKDMPRVGQIGLQNHGAKVWFKNIKIKPLDKSAK